MSTHGLAPAQPAATPTGVTVSAAPYLMRPLTSDADRAEAAALVQDRQRQLITRGIHLPDHHAAQFRVRTNSIGLYDHGPEGEEGLAACLLLNRRLLDDDATGADMTLSLVYTAPDRDDQVSWLITLWAADYAARISAPWAHGETPSRHAGRDDCVGRLLHYCEESLQWRVTGSYYDPTGNRSVRLRLIAQRMPELQHLITCSVPIHPTTQAFSLTEPR
ncbi:MULTISPECIES: hypothetical protein [Streptomyces]|uniref:Uncharacterized protein n=1 Tax=Streptomyces xanthochromogenes TaxID=67384 RepID=A0ABQ2ZGL2_9ACTN|nr:MULTISPECIES: hypothetical protein [Streptomyces]MYV93045.1 hypothetical protein [Streptomyces sp. SID1034]GGY13603.1 hypothetical protein GCM10010326_01110 [Streptomyces xanthochromogenes]